LSRPADWYFALEIGEIAETAKRSGLERTGCFPGGSVALRDRLVGEIAGLQSQESATDWAREALAAKNRLTSADAKLLEDPFEQRLTRCRRPMRPPSAVLPKLPSPVARRLARAAVLIVVSPAANDKSGLAVAAPRRYRNKEHLRYVARQPASYAVESLRTRITCASRSRWTQAVSRPSRSINVRRTA
jgi:hypothetical protein